MKAWRVNGLNDAVESADLPGYVVVCVLFRPNDFATTEIPDQYRVVVELPAQDDTRIQRYPQVHKYVLEVLWLLNPSQYFPLRRSRCVSAARLSTTNSRVSDHEREQEQRAGETYECQDVHLSLLHADSVD